VKKDFYQFIRFSIVGLSNTIIDLGFFNLLLSLGVDTYLSASISFLIAATNSYVLNRYWTFNDRQTTHLAAQYTRFMVVSGLGLLLNNLIIFLLTTAFRDANQWYLVNAGKLLAIGLVVLWNYFGSRYFVFKKQS
jgi:putative flippase GtrA